MGLRVSSHLFGKAKEEIVDLEAFDFDEFDEQYFNTPRYIGV